LRGRPGPINHPLADAVAVEVLALHGDPRRERVDSRPVELDGIVHVRHQPLQQRAGRAYALCVGGGGHYREQDDEDERARNHGDGRRRQYQIRG
jgi:hypothetical protein